MRRKDREVTDANEIRSVISQCDVCRIGLSNGGVPYIVPMNFGFDFSAGKLTLYFHGAGEGRKHDIIKENPAACFEMDRGHKVVHDADAGKYTMEFESVIGTGKISYCDREDEKHKALTLLMKQYAPEKDFAFPPGLIAGITIFKLEAEELSCKKNPGTPQT